MGTLASFLAGGGSYVLLALSQISIAYINLWIEKIVQDEDGNEKTELKLWELKSVRHDFELLLARHKCKPDANGIVSDAERERSGRHQRRTAKVFHMCGLGSWIYQLGEHRHQNG